MQELQDALEKEKAKEDERSLAEIAAERSAKALRETQASTQVGSGLMVVTQLVYLAIGVFAVLASTLQVLVVQIEG